MHTSDYDDYPYPSLAFRLTHPDHLAVVATLFGLAPVVPAQARVLELGGASGGNLIPLALVYPQATFLGVDLSRRQIDEGQKMVAALGLKNVELRHASIMDVDDGYGTFDYILCHGVFSWVAREVQDKILDICRSNLAPDGVALVSYNTLPGWRMRGAIREMLQYHVGRYPDKNPANQVTQARSLLDFLAASCQDEKSAYGQFLKEEIERQRNLLDPHLYHDHLEEHNEPIYFHEFAARLSVRGLRYLAESDVRQMNWASYPANVREVLQRLAPDVIQMEQYLDFMRNRTFRYTLICHQHQRPNYNVLPTSMSAFQVASRLKPKSSRPDLNGPAPEEFQDANVGWVRTNEPITKAAMICLAEHWPRAIPFAELCRLARHLLDGSDATDPVVIQNDHLHLGRTVLSIYAESSDISLRLWLRQPEFAFDVSDHPLASPLARLQTASGADVTNLLHETVTLGPFLRQLLPYLDGANACPTLLEYMVEHHRQGRLTLFRNDIPVRDEPQARPFLTKMLDQQLLHAARLALLLA
jgi:methyltransferase-like protein/2-polyprenyl-3-methyl-5-hydroxy-6-metoxy-1,4-benzoquinol methylase